MKRTMIGLSLMLLAVPALVSQMTMPMPADQKPATMPDCAAMMQKEDAMKQHMAQMNARLQTLLDDMNKASGSAKMEKMAAVINELVAQRSMMQNEMMTMQPQMMEHMAGCPMMKKDSTATPPPAAEHH